MYSIQVELSKVLLSLQISTDFDFICAILCFKVHIPEVFRYAKQILKKGDIWHIFEDAV